MEILLTVINVNNDRTVHYYSNYDTMSVLPYQSCEAAADSAAAARCNKHNNITLTAIKCFGVSFSVIEKNIVFKLDAARRVFI